MPLPLTRSNIESEIRKYLADVDSLTIPSIPTSDPIRYFSELKRTALDNGRYPQKTIFEVANRTLSDLVVLGVADELLREPLPGQAEPIAAVQALLGTEDDGSQDITGTLPDGSPLHGECFNVAPSFFSSKLNKTRKKLRAVQGNGVKLIAFNHDAVANPWNHRSHWVIHRRVNVEAFLARYR